MGLKKSCCPQIPSVQLFFFLYFAFKAFAWFRNGKVKNARQPRLRLCLFSRLSINAHSTRSKDGTCGYSVSKHGQRVCILLRHLFNYVVEHHLTNVGYNCRCSQIIGWRGTRLWLLVSFRMCQALQALVRYNLLYRMSDQLLYTFTLVSIGHCVMLLVQT